MAKSFPKIIGSIWEREEIMRTAAVFMSLMLTGILFLDSSSAASSSDTLRANLAALQKTSPGSASERALQKKIIGIVRKMKRKPPLPDKVDRHMARGETFVEKTTGTSGFKLAANEFRAVARLAPWLARAYYNLGVVQEKAGRYDAAKESFGMYIFAAPNAPDARKVKRLIYKIEARKELAAKEAAERRLQEQARLGAERDRRRQQERSRRDRKQAKILDALKFGKWCQTISNNCHMSASVSIKGSGGGQIKIRVNWREGSYQIYDGGLSGNILSGSFSRWVCCNRKGIGTMLPKGTFKGEIDSSGRTIRVRSRYVWNGKVIRDEVTFTKR